MPPIEKQKRSFRELLLTISSATSAIIAIVVIFAWWGTDVIIASLSEDYVPMTLSIALTVLLISGSILLRTAIPLDSKMTWIPMGISFAAILLSLVLIIEFAANQEYGVDELLGAGSKQVEGYELAQPSPISIFTLLIASVATLLSFIEKPASRWGIVVPALSLYVFSIGILITLGYAYGSPLLYGGSVRPVSILAGLAYGMLGTALICLQGPYRWPVNAFVGPSVRARLLRSFVPLIVFLVLLSGSLSNRALSSSSNPALTVSTIALLTAIVVGYVITRLSTRIGGQIDRTNEMLLKTEAELKQANEKLGVLGSITRHDALNRLAVVLGRMELLQGSTDNKNVQKQAKESLDAARAIQKIIQFTGEYQKIGVGGPVWVDVEEAFRDALVGVDHEAISIKSEVSGLEIYADRMFEKVLANLVDNSVRHGKHLKTLKLHHKMDNEGLVLVYEDDGGGLSEDDKANLFKRGHGKHTGLGMFLSKEILEFSGMSIRETGESGVGARFEITIPSDKFRMVNP